MIKTKQLLMDVYFRVTENYTVRNETLLGKEYIVVPAVMMVEGVHSGSHGAVLHTTEELGSTPESWNNIPVTLSHPQVNGGYVSANSPEILIDWGVGLTFNTHMDGDKLKTEVWVEVNRMQELDPDTLERINNGETIEVSVGVFSTDEEVSGTFNGENYVAIARNHKPDHLALLPDEVGACSIDDGCGLRVNKSSMSKEKFILNSENKIEVLKELNRQGFSVFETGFRELADKARDAVYAKDGNGFSYYLDEMFSDYLVYREHNYNNDAAPTKLYKQTYQENAAGEVEFIGEAVQVKREVTYPNVPQMNSDGTIKRKRTKFNNNQKGKEMSKDCQVCKDKASALIANTATKFTEDDRDFLEGLEVNQLDKLEPTTVTKTVPGSVSNEQIMSAFQESVKTPEDFLKFVPEGMRDQFASGLEMQTNAKAVMTEAIMANTYEGVWTKEELEAMPTSSVTKIYKSVKPADSEEAPIFMGAPANLQANVNEEVEAMAPLGVDFETPEN